MTHDRRRSNQAKAEALAPEEQQEVLQFVEFLSERKGNAKNSRRPTIESVQKALAAAPEIWKDRTDLPVDSAEAAQVLRERAMDRGIQ